MDGIAEKFIMDKFKILALSLNKDEDKIQQDLLVLFKSKESMDRFAKTNQLLVSFNKFPIAVVRVDKQKFAEIRNSPDVGAIEPDDVFFVQLNEVSKIVKTKIIANSFFGFSGKNVVVGLVDTGLDKEHPDLRGQIISCENFTDETDDDEVGHGTAVAGIICGTGKASDEAFKGMAPDAKLIMYKLFGKSGTCHFSDFVFCLEEIIADKDKQLPEIICLPFTSPIFGFKSVIMEKYLEYLENLGIILITCAGNFGPDPNSLGYPATSDHVICVGSYNENWNPAFFSSRGTKEWPNSPDLILNGSNIITPAANSTNLGKPYKANNYYSINTGTSLSAGIMTGICAVIKEAFPKITPKEIKEDVLKYCYRISDVDSAEGKGTFDLSTYFAEKKMIIKKPMPFSLLAKNGLKIGVYTMSLLVILLVIIEYYLKVNRGI